MLQPRGLACLVSVLYVHRSLHTAYCFMHAPEGTAVDQNGALLPNVDAARDQVINYIRANGGADFHLVGVNFHFQSCNALSNCEAGIAAGMGWTAPEPGQPNIAAAAMTQKVADRGTAGDLLRDLSAENVLWGYWLLLHVACMGYTAPWLHEQSVGELQGSLHPQAGEHALPKMSFTVGSMHCVATDMVSGTDSRSCASVCRVHQLLIWALTPSKAVRGRGIDVACKQVLRSLRCWEHHVGLIDLPDSLGEAAKVSLKGCVCGRHHTTAGASSLLQPM